ncbi:MAG: hypothetical protein KJ964_00590 [Verrucomicrobia bacterium]|nr:hypothetical protein [Verrucomicrobiota bacterium]MBU1736163.1 hypothetical protein [Verrucomicrobiota bacterium]MBU1856763.1 hypothetical protein [Verrucomicrobiota bacterium]
MDEMRKTPKLSKMTIALAFVGVIMLVWGMVTMNPADRDTALFGMFVMGLTFLIGFSPVFAACAPIKCREGSYFSLIDTLFRAAGLIVSVFSFLVLLIAIPNILGIIVLDPSKYIVVNSSTKAFIRYATWADVAPRSVLYIFLFIIFWIGGETLLILLAIGCYKNMKDCFNRFRGIEQSVTDRPYSLAIKKRDSAMVKLLEEKGAK